MKLPINLSAKSAVGVEVSADTLKFASLSNKGHLLLDGYETVNLPEETIRFSHRELNILQPEAFVEHLRRGHLKMLARSPRVSVSLPDSVGRVILVDLDTRFKNREEGFDLIRWKMKKAYALDMEDMHLDYQVIAQRETGEISVLVSMITRPIIQQYEDLFLKAGVEPVRVDFTTFNLYRLFAQRLDIAENAAVFTYYEGSVSILVFYEGALEFYRTKELPTDDFDVNRVYQEISNSLLVYTDKNPGRSFQEVFCFCSPTESEALRSIAREATDVEPIALDEEKSISCREGLSCDKSTLHTLAASIGAAKGLMS